MAVILVRTDRRTVSVHPMICLYQLDVHGLVNQQTYQVVPSNVFIVAKIGKILTNHQEDKSILVILHFRILLYNEKEIPPYAVTCKSIE